VQITKKTRYNKDYLTVKIHQKLQARTERRNWTELNLTDMF